MFLIIKTSFTLVSASCRKPQHDSTLQTLLGSAYTQIEKIRFYTTLHVFKSSLSYFAHKVLIYIALLWLCYCLTKSLRFEILITLFYLVPLIATLHSCTYTFFHIYYLTLGIFNFFIFFFCIR